MSANSQQNDNGTALSYNTPRLDTETDATPNKCFKKGEKNTTDCKSISTCAETARFTNGGLELTNEKDKDQEQEVSLSGPTIF